VEETALILSESRLYGEHDLRWFALTDGITSSSVVSSMTARSTVTDQPRHLSENLRIIDKCR
jgi:hypothetical protein